MQLIGRSSEHIKTFSSLMRRRRATKKKKRTRREHGHGAILPPDHASKVHFGNASDIYFFFHSHCCFTRTRGGLRACMRASERWLTWVWGPRNLRPRSLLCKRWEEEDGGVRVGHPNRNKNRRLWCICKGVYSCNCEGSLGLLFAAEQSLCISREGLFVCLLSFPTTP